MAIAYIEDHWNTLYAELISWNTEYGSVLNSEITEAWNNCLAAAQRYGSYVAALNSIDTDISAAGNSVPGSNGVSNNTIVGVSGNTSTPTDEEQIHAIIKRMYANSQEWFSARDSGNTARQQALENDNIRLGQSLARYGVQAHRENGTWYVSDGSLLFDKYRKYIYHGGGVAGDNPTLKQNEILAVLEKGEMILDKKKEDALYRTIQLLSAASDKVGNLMNSAGMSGAFNIAQNGIDSIRAPLPGVTNNQNEAIHFGDINIYGANDDTVRQHQEINRRFTNEVLAQLRIKR